MGGGHLQVFRLIAFDEPGPVAGSSNNRRLVCKIEGGGKIAIWGSEDSMQNINAVLAAGLRCNVECTWREPNLQHAEKYGHTHWVRQDFPLRVVK